MEVEQLHESEDYRRLATEVLQRVDRDRRAAPEELRPLLAYIYSNLFDPDLNVEQLKRACRMRSGSVGVEFHWAMGESPGSYIESRRMETAKVLLARTSLPVWRIAQFLGYSSVQVFSRAFRRWEGESARAYRRRRWLQATSRRPQHGQMFPYAPAVVSSKAAACHALLRQMRIAEEGMRRLFQLRDDSDLHKLWEGLQRVAKRLEPKLREFAGDSGAKPQDGQTADSGWISP